MIFVDDKVIEEEPTLFLSERQIASFNGRSSVVKRLYLYSNQIVSFSAEEGAFPNLRELILFYNRLTSFSHAGFPNLKELDLSGNQLISFSSEEGAFPNLKAIDLSGNQLISFSAEEGAFPALKDLELSDNQLASFVAEEGAFPKLRKLYLSNNPNLEILELKLPKLRKLWIGQTKIRFLDGCLIGKVKDRNDVQAHYHTQGTKCAVIESRHKGCPIIGEIIDHLSR